MKFRPTKTLPTFLDNTDHWESIKALDSIQQQLMHLGVQLQRIADAVEEMAFKDRDSWDTTNE